MLYQSFFRIMDLSQEFTDSMARGLFETVRRKGSVRAISDSLREHLFDANRKPKEEFHGSLLQEIGLPVAEDIAERTFIWDDDIKDRVEWMVAGYASISFKALISEQWSFFYYGGRAFTYNDNGRTDYVVLDAGKNSIEIGIEVDYTVIPDVDLVGQEFITVIFDENEKMVRAEHLPKNDMKVTREWKDSWSLDVFGQEYYDPSVYIKSAKKQ